MALIKFAPMAAQTCASPSNSATINLGAALSGRSTFRTWLPTGTTMGYEMTDGTDWEEGYGVLTHGTPDTLTRIVTRNSLGTTNRIAFAGAVTVISYPPSASVVVLDTAGDIPLPGTLAVAGQIGAAGGGWIIKMGTFGGTTGALSGGVAEATVAVTFGSAFATACRHVFVNADDVSGGALQELANANRSSFTTSGFTAYLSCKQAATAMTGSYIALGH